MPFDLGIRPRVVRVATTHCGRTWPSRPLTNLDLSDSNPFALLAAAIGSARLLRPLEVIRKATRRLTEGNYSERVTPPRESELAALANDVNTLASALPDTEARRMRLVSEVANELRTRGTGS